MGLQVCIINFNKLVKSHVSEKGTLNQKVGDIVDTSWQPESLASAKTKRQECGECV